ncbi:MAG: cell division protein FtsZ [Saprospiraceae bacterium]|jgi:cell division protein FtsZ
MLFDLPQDEGSIIKVIGVGGGGSNAVTHMFNQGIVGVDFAICNTDNQAMELSPVPTRISLGPELTGGRGAGSKPNIGRQACLETIEEVKQFLENDTKMLFVTAGMGGGTGTGAAPIIAKAAQEMDILTVGIVTLPFTFEGRRRSSQGVDGLEELKKHVDTLIVISNDKLRQIHGNLSISEAFSEADNILTTAARGIAEIITVAGYVNVDFEDVNTVMRGSGVAIMGTASAEGDDRAKVAVDKALNSPLLEENNIKGAQHILLNITSGTREVTMDEIFEITEFVQEEAGYGTDLIWGNCYDESLGDKISVTVIATGFEHNKKKVALEEKVDNKVVVSLDDDTHQKKTGLFDLGHDDTAENAKTVEFNNIRESIVRYQKDRYSYDEPYIKSEDKQRLEEERSKRMEMEAERRERLRNVSTNLSNPKNIVEMENQPAYMRRRVNLDDVQHSSEVDLSNWSVSEGDEPELKDNKYLHDNVD